MKRKINHVTSSFLTRATFPVWTARNNAVTSVLNSSYSTRTSPADSSRNNTSVLLAFKHTTPTKLTSTNGSAMHSNADFRSPECEASRSRCETSASQSTGNTCFPVRNPPPEWPKTVIFRRRVWNGGQASVVSERGAKLGCERSHELPLQACFFLSLQSRDSRIENLKEVSARDKEREEWRAFIDMV